MCYWNIIWTQRTGKSLDLSVRCKHRGLFHGVCVLAHNQISSLGLSMFYISLLVGLAWHLTPHWCSLIVINCRDTLVRSLSGLGAFLWSILATSHSLCSRLVTQNLVGSLRLLTVALSTVNSFYFMGKKFCSLIMMDMSVDAWILVFSN